MEHLFKFKNLNDLEKGLGDERQCRGQYEALRFSNGIFCPHCGNEKYYTIKPGKHNSIYKCATCKKRFNCFTGTIFESTKLPFIIWCKAIFLMSSRKKGISSVEMGSVLGVSQQTAWFMKHRIRDMIKNRDEDQLKGVVMVDETFVGGKNKNRHADKKVKHTYGRSFSDKTPVVGLIQQEKYIIIERPNKNNGDKIIREKVITSPAKLITHIVPNTTIPILNRVVHKFVKHGSVLVTDEWHGYNNLTPFYNHSRVDHFHKQYVNENGYSTNRIEGAWKHFKLTIQATHHNVSRKHLFRYADEFAFRYNYRHLDNRGRFVKALSNSFTRLKYKDLTTTSEYPIQYDSMPVISKNQDKETAVIWIKEAIEEANSANVPLEEACPIFVNRMVKNGYVIEFSHLEQLGKRIGKRHPARFAREKYVSISNDWKPINFKK